MESRMIMRYMRELGYQYKPTLSKCGKHVFRRKADGKLTKPASWAYYADAIHHHPRYAEARRKIKLHSVMSRNAKDSPEKYRAFVKAGLITPAEARVKAKEGKYGVRARR